MVMRRLVGVVTAVLALTLTGAGVAYADTAPVQANESHHSFDKCDGHRFLNDRRICHHAEHGIGGWFHGVFHHPFHSNHHAHFGKGR
jgi:hypothetical protein